ncbi:MAG: RNA polymerase sigma-70 factor (ECF subfamily) [Planctomycetota bacterium]|jgi:RNA polymerase sigma-70 factor (ECF subfamily)
MMDEERDELGILMIRKDRRATPETEAPKPLVENFDELLERHSREIQVFLYKLCGNHHDAEELAQDVFVKAFRKLSTLREAGATRRWLYTIAVNHFNDWIKPKRRAILRTVLEIEEQIIEDGKKEQPQEAALSHELSEWLREATMQLPERQRTVLLLFSATGFDYQEIASTLNISTDAVKMSLFHARERLRIQVDRYLKK